LGYGRHSGHHGNFGAQLFDHIGRSVWLSRGIVAVCSCLVETPTTLCCLSGPAARCSGSDESCLKCGTRFLGGVAYGLERNDRTDWQRVSQDIRGTKPRLVAETGACKPDGKNATP